jgi:predicted secreted protein
MLRLLLTFLVLLAFLSVAHAADGATFRAIGFSTDSRYFAFEQYGVQDGSGFAYADLFVLDTQKDAWLKGTPISVTLEDETLDVSAVRQKLKEDGKSALSSAQILVDAEVLAANPFTEVQKDRASMTFHNHYNNAMGMFGTTDDQGSWTLTTLPVAVPLPEGCEADIGVTGYKLAIRNNKSGDVKVLHLDTSLPKTRFCAVGYDIEAVVQPAGAADGSQMVAVVGVYRRGFEGADRRFIAIPFKLN